MVESIFFTPHPPIAVDEIGGREVNRIESTRNSFKALAKRLREIAPDTVVYVSPHARMEAGKINLLGGTRLGGDFGRFRAAFVSCEKETDVELTHQLAAALRGEGAQVGAVNDGLDHGVLVPMYFFDKEYADYKVVVLAPGFFTARELYSLGRRAGEVLEGSQKRVVVLASGDLSHKLLADGPYGYAKEGVDFDAFVTGLFEGNRVDGLLDYDPALLDKAAECAYNPFCFALGMADGREKSSRLMSYEGPFGVGYMVAELTLGERRGQGVKRRYADPHLQLAWDTVESYVRYGKRPGLPDGLPDEMTGRRAGTFVTLYKAGSLRGCIGTIGPTQESVAAEIAYCAVESCSADPRFFPVAAYELDSLEVKVDVLSPIEPISGPEALDPLEYGVIVEQGFRRGLLLPRLDGINTVDEQLAAVLHKAGIEKNAKDIRMSRFRVVRHEE